MLPRAFVALLLLPLSGLAAGVVAGEAAAVGDRPEMLRRAFRFASVIANDERDRSWSQYQVVQQAVALNEITLARALANNASGWAKGLALIEVAQGLPSDDSARGQLFAEAAAIREATEEGWARGRLTAALLRAGAEAPAGASQLTDPVDRLRVALAAVETFVANGEAEAALGNLREAHTGLDIETVPFFVRAALVALASLPEAQTTEIPALLDTAVKGIGLSTAARGLFNLPATVRDHPAVSAWVTATLDRAETAARQTRNPLVRAPVLADVARAWLAWGGETGRARALALAQAAAPSIRTLEAWEIPLLLAPLAEVAAQAGDLTLAHALFAESLSTAATLENPRPRALALAAICRAWAASGNAAPAGTQEQLDRLYDGVVAQYAARGLIVEGRLAAPAP